MSSRECPGAALRSRHQPLRVSSGCVHRYRQAGECVLGKDMLHGGRKILEHASWAPRACMQNYHGHTGFLCKISQTHRTHVQNSHKHRRLTCKTSQTHRLTCKARLVYPQLPPGSEKRVQTSCKGWSELYVHLLHFKLHGFGGFQWFWVAVNNSGCTLVILDGFGGPGWFWATLGGSG